MPTPSKKKIVKKKPLKTLYAPVNKKRKREPAKSAPRIHSGVGADYWALEKEIRAAYLKAIEPTFKRGRPRKVKVVETPEEVEALIAAELEKPDPEVF